MSKRAKPFEFFTSVSRFAPFMEGCSLIKSFHKCARSSLLGSSISTSSNGSKISRNASLSCASLAHDAKTYTLGFSTAERISRMASRAPFEALTLCPPKRAAHSAQSSSSSHGKNSPHRSTSSRISTPEPSISPFMVFRRSPMLACAITQRTRSPWIFSST